MRILVVIYEFPPVGGGGGQAANDICRGLVNLGHEIVVLTAHLKGLPLQEEIDGFQVTRVPSARRQAYKADLLAMGGFVVSGSLAALRLIRKWQPHLIHVHFAVPSGPVAWMLSRFKGYPYVLTAHLGDVPGGVPDKTRKWFRWFYPFTPQIWHDATHVIAVSEYTRQLALRHYPVEMQVIPNGVDLNRLDPGEIHVRIPPLVVFAGRFVPQKNPVQVVKTLAELRDIPWECVMIGDGDLRTNVEYEIEKNELQERFVLTGWITPKEVIEWFAKCDLLYMPSLSEGLPVVGVHALAMGLAIVASPVGGFVELISEGENGYLVQLDHPEEGRECLREVLSDIELLRSLRVNSRRKATRFNLDTIVDEYLKIFKEVIG